MSERSSRNVKEERLQAGGRSVLAGKDKAAPADPSIIEVKEVAGVPRVVQLEQELEATKVELQDAIADITEYKQAAATANHDLQQPLQALVLLKGQLATNVENDRSQEQAAKTQEILETIANTADSSPNEDQIGIAHISVQEISKPEQDASDIVIVESAHRTGAILVIADDAGLRELLDLLLRDEGHHAVTSPDGSVALELVAQGTIRPDLILADYNLPNGMNGLQMIAKVREELERPIPAILLTGNIPVEILGLIALQDCTQIDKPVKLKELAQTIQLLLPPPPPVEVMPDPPPAASDRRAPIIYIVDDEEEVRDALRSVLEESGRTVAVFSTTEAFLQAYHPGRIACLVIDATLPGMDRLELLQQLDRVGHTLPVIMINGECDVQMVVEAMRAGVLDFIEKPIGRTELLASVESALEQSQDLSKLSASRAFAADRIGDLTPRQHQIMNLMLTGELSKNIAADLGISQRTVESHRASIMKRTGSKSLPALARLVLLAARNGAPPAQPELSLTVGQGKSGTRAA